MTKDIAVTEVAQERVGEHIDQQATECRADNGNVILNAVRCAEILQLEHLVSKHAADNADDEFKDKGGDGIAGSPAMISAKARPIAPARPPETPSSIRAVSAVKVLPRWKEEPVPSTLGMRKNSYATKLSAAIIPMVAIFWVVNLVLLSAAIRIPSATTTNSRSHITAVDMDDTSPHFAIFPVPL